MLFRIAIGLFCLGAAAGIAALVPIFTGADPLPTVYYFVAMLAPLGFALMLIGLLRNAVRGHHSVEGSNPGV